ncbi:low-density lipoprotein receptor-related protein 11 isoform X1 [Takifugu flavidus]|uniref:low-density lipoprotein receptor-related protein 11 isoform X1 n=1 Tax=Takifugu flavidus TaxID=433684 RepID=UPI0025446CE1|nr:low-density lipoprotein receptor-related protein 11 isoform X1 [Takifugu flavidus]
MALPQHHPRMLLAAVLLMLALGRRVTGRSSPISDLKSKISGVEELLEEFRQQLQQEQSYKVGGVTDSCVGDFGSLGDSIIQTRPSIEQGAAFLLVPDRVFTWKDCLHACCSQPHCTVAVVREDPRQPGKSLKCYLFNCTYRNKHVCSFSPHPGFSAYSRDANSSQGHLPGPAGGSATMTGAGQPGEGDAPVSQHRKISKRYRGFLADGADADEPPRSDAGQDVVIQLPTDWAILDGRDSVDDHEISHYEWTLVRGDTAINMKSTHPGLLKISGLQEGVYNFKLTVTDSGGQKSSDDVSVTVLPPKQQAEGCTGHCSNYQFKCDDGCCIDITYACDGKQQCPDRSDEDFCSDFNGGRKSVTHPADPLSRHRTADGAARTAGAPQDRKTSAPPQSSRWAETQGPCAVAPVVGPCKGTFPRWYYDQNAGECKHFLYGGCQGNHNNFLQESDCISDCIQKSPAFKPATTAPPVTTQAETVSQSHVGSEAPVSKPVPVMGGHPVPETGAILPLALGLIITALLLLMIGCRLRLVRHKLKKARPLSTEESDYLINGMYL